MIINKKNKINKILEKLDLTDYFNYNNEMMLKIKYKIENYLSISINKEILDSLEKNILYYKKLVINYNLLKKAINQQKKIIFNITEYEIMDIEIPSFLMNKFNDLYSKFIIDYKIFKILKNNLDTKLSKLAYLSKIHYKNDNNIFINNSNRIIKNKELFLFNKLNDYEKLVLKYYKNNCAKNNYNIIEQKNTTIINNENIHVSNKSIYQNISDIVLNNFNYSSIMNKSKLYNSVILNKFNDNKINNFNNLINKSSYFINHNESIIPNINYNN